MSGFQHDIAGGNGNLVITSVQSPNFSSGSTGWQVAKDGSAEFNNLTIRGTFKGNDFILNSSGFFLYSSTPALGNLIGSWAASAGTDGFGNVYRAGLTSYSGAYSVDLTGAAVEFLSSSTVLASISPAGALIYDSTGQALGHLINSLSSIAGTDAAGNSYPQGLMSQQLTLVNQGSAPPAFTNASVFYSSTAGRPRYLSQAGNDSILERSSVNVAQFTVGNTITAGNISAPLNYLANEGDQSSEYEIEIMGVVTGGPTASVQTLDFRVYMDGSNAGGGFTIGSTVFSSTSTNNQTFVYTVRFLMTVLTSGVSGTMNIHSDGSIAATANKVTTDGADLGGNVNGVAFDTTTNHTFQLKAFWGGTATGQTLTTYRTKTARRD